jgi:IMP dehydrogenase
MTDKIVGTALTFDDVLLVPAKSTVLPNQVDLRTRLVGGIHLNIPLISAAMDTVTGSQTAITMARLGGLGIIHKGYPIDKQAAKVSKVKRSQSGQITKPYYLGPSARLNDVRRLMEEHNISGVPIVEKGKKLIGLVTKRDILFLPESANPRVREIMKQRSELIVAPPETTLAQAKEILHKHRIEKLPLVDDHDVLFGLITVKDILKEVQYPQAVRDSKGRLLVGAAIGAGTDLKERTAALVDAGVDVLCLDSSHGHSLGVLEAAKWVKSKYPAVPLIGGNIATYQGAKDLIASGVDAVKVGMGPGSICTTRVVTGGGMPQITAIMEAARAAREHDIPVIADGGIQFSGDISKALAAGADTVMIGSLFAGTEESPGETVLVEGRSYKVYRGMGSIDAMKESGGERYFQENAAKMVAEGIVGRVPFRGSLSEVIFQLIGGLRSGMGLAGSANIEELQQAKLVQVTSAGVRESHPHDVVITKEAPNYPGQERR